MPHLPAASVLSDITVLDLTRVRSGPTCVRQLADWGADVIKVEIPPILEGNNGLASNRNGSDFQNLHRNKRSLTLNLKETEGLNIFNDLVKKADVVVENYRPDVKNRLGIDYETLAKINNQIILASISGFGQNGPYAKRPGFDQVAQGMGGLMSITGLPGQGPVRAGIPIADLTAGIFCSQGILLALIERQKSGKGQWLHTSLLEAQIFMLDFQSARWLIDEEVPWQAGNNHPTSIPTGVFKTSDGHMNISVSGGAIWKRFCEEMGHIEWIGDTDYIDSEARSTNRDKLNKEIEECTIKETTTTWINRFNKAGVPCGPIYSMDEVFSDPQVESLGIAQSLNSPLLGELKFVRQPVNLTRTPSSFVVAPPEAGEHTNEILSELGYSEDDVHELKIKGVV